MTWLMHSKAERGNEHGVPGTFGVVVGFVIAGGLMVKFVVGGRYYR